MKSKMLVLLLILCVSSVVQAVPVAFTYETTITVTGPSVFGVSTGDTLTTTVIADNGGTDLLSQQWFQANVLSAVSSVGAYLATFNFPFFNNDPSFSTNAAGNVSGSWFDIDGNNTDNIGPGSPGFYANALVTSNNSTFNYDSSISWTAQVQTQAVPEPATMALLGLGLLGLGMTRRKTNS